MTDAGLFAIAIALFFGLKAIAEATRKRVVVIDAKDVQWTVNLVHHKAPEITIP